MFPVTTSLAVGLPFNISFAFVLAALGYAATFLMLHLWGYPYDKDTRTSEAPKWAMRIHRILGYAFVACYIVMMWRMVPRLFSYQVELPARTVAHILLGVTVGFLLLIKISIARFFGHLEEWMPYLGVAVLLCTTLLIVLSLPAAFREHSLAHGTPGGDPFGPQSLERVARLLPDADLPAGTDLKRLATADALQAGRSVLIDQCTFCHDLKTVLDKPRPPATWANVVERMAEKPSLSGVISEADQGRVTAYLIAITPDLQRSAKQRRSDAMPTDDDDGSTVDAGVADPLPLADAGASLDAASEIDAGAVRDAGVVGDAGVPGDAAVPAAKPTIEPAQAKATFLRKCSGCHEVSDVDGSPPTTTAAIRKLIRRMIENGLKASRREIEQITWWLDAHYVRKAQ